MAEKTITDYCDHDIKHNLLSSLSPNYFVSISYAFLPYSRTLYWDRTGIEDGEFAFSHKCLYKDLLYKRFLHLRHLTLLHS